MAEGITLLSHLTGMLTPRIEETATEALGYILRKSAKSREGLDDLVRSGAGQVAPVAEVTTQSYRDDGTRVDLIGRDEYEVERVLIEAKFRAELQPTQPVAYLNRLTGDGPTVLMFVVPEDRIRLLWRDLRQRLSDAELGFAEGDGERKCVQLNGTEKHLMVVSWAGLLDCMLARSREGEDWSIESDIRQLRGLAEYAEAENFQPFRGRGDSFGADQESQRRDRDLRQIIDRVTDHGVNDGWLDRKGLNRALKSHGYGRYIRFPHSGAVPWFGINYDLYKESGETPLWLWFGPPNADKRFHLRPLQFEAICTVLKPMNADGWFPLELPKDLDLHLVVEQIAVQLKTLLDVIDSAGS